MASDPSSFEIPKNVRFKCDRCALCCGDTETKVRTILLMRVEAEHISNETKRTISDFAVRGRNREPYAYQMRKTPEGKCLFLRNDRCTIYDSRPLVCRFYPFELKELGGDAHVFSVTSECPCVNDGPVLEKEYFQKLYDELRTIMRENNRA